ncbi:MAG: type II secretion system F family protein [Raoultibacter sp.]
MMLIGGILLTIAALATGTAVIIYHHRAVVTQRDREYAEFAAQPYPTDPKRPTDNHPKTGSFIEGKLLGAGIKTTPARFVAGFMGLASVAGFLIAALSKQPFGFIGGIALVAIILVLQIHHRITERAKVFDRQLAAALPMIAENLRGGLTVQSALTTVAQYLDDPLHTELTRVVNDVATANMTLSAALNRLGSRMKNPDVELLATTVAIQKTGGGNLADILDSLAATISKRLEMRGHIDAITSSARLSAIIVGAMPFALLALLSFASPGYMADFWASPLWLPALIIVTVLDVTGLFVIRRMYTLEIS